MRYLIVYAYVCSVTFTLALLLNPVMAAIPCPIAQVKAAKKPPAVTINADMTVTTADPTTDHDDAPTAAPSSSSSSDVVNTVSKGSGSSKQLFHTVLVIAPVNTLENWQEEYARYTAVHSMCYIYDMLV